MIEATAALSTPSCGLNNGDSPAKNPTSPCSAASTAQAAAAAAALDEDEDEEGAPLLSHHHCRHQRRRVIACFYFSLSLLLLRLWRGKALLPLPACHRLSCCCLPSMASRSRLLSCA